MGFWHRKSVVEEYEEEFKTKRMKNRRVFYDLNIRAEDPEEFRARATELMQDADYGVVVNKLTSFEDVDVEGVFRGGKLKPIRGVIKGLKEIKKGSKFPFLWKLFTILAVLAPLYAYFFGGMHPEQFKTYLYSFSIFSIIVAFALYRIKEKVNIAVWLKLVGVYNVSDEQADLRVVIAGDCEKKDKKAFSELEEDIGEVYNVLSKKYIKTKKVPKVIVVKEETAETKIFKKIREVESEKGSLNKRLIAGKLSEKTFNELRDELNKKKHKLETMLDIISLS